MMKYILFLIFLSLSPFTAADVGVILPGDSDKPDESVLSLEELRIDVRIDHQHARVRMIQIFGNHTNRPQEGRYIFAIPSDAAISDFAVWDGVVRIPGVILERKRASELYEDIRMQNIDPGLLQQEEGAEGPRMAGAFSARIIPIPAFATKRLEMEYTQRLNIEGLKSYFSIPLKPDLFRAQKCAVLTISVEAESSIPLTDFRFLSNTTYPMEFTARSPQKVAAKFQANNILLSEDLALEYALQTNQSALSFLSFRGTEQNLRDPKKPVTAFDKPIQNAKPEPGYFWASVVLNEKAAKSREPLSVLIYLDISSSMRWEKLEQSYRALEYFLSQLRETDTFQLTLFHQEAKSATATAVPVNRGNVEEALRFVKKQYLMGGTDFQKALSHAASAAAGLQNANRYLLLITDGNPTLTQIKTRRLLDDFRKVNKQARLRVFAFGIGADANRFLLSGLAEASNGHFDSAAETENITFKLEAFAGKLGYYPAENLVLQTKQTDLFFQVYPSEPVRLYDGSAVDWFGRYSTPANKVSLSVTGNHAGQSIRLAGQVDLPEESTEHDFIPRGWARKRVDALLRKIDLEGEDQASIDEIIRLSKKYKFVTPYTSFLAAPRSLLRPRVIRPGDPLLRVKTDPEIASVIAIFPFGLIKDLRYLPEEDVWQTRFLVPKDVSDGVYYCRLILCDRFGNQYEEKKSYVVDSKPPTIRPKSIGPAKSGNNFSLEVLADRDVRNISARLGSLPAAAIRWDNVAQACKGAIRIPHDFPKGVYELRIVAEDFAHNQTVWTKQVEVF